MREDTPALITRNSSNLEVTVIRLSLSQLALLPQLHLPFRPGLVLLSKPPPLDWTPWLQLSSPTSGLGGARPSCPSENLRLREEDAAKPFWPSRSTAEGGQKTDPLVGAGPACWEWGQGQAGKGGRISSSQTGVPESAALLTPISALRPSQVHSLPAQAPLPS